MALRLAGELGAVYLRIDTIERGMVDSNKAMSAVEAYDIGRHICQAASGSSSGIGVIAISTARSASMTIEAVGAS